MVHIFDGYNYILRLDKGENLVETLQKFVAGTNLEGAWISAIGGVQEVTLGFYDLDKKEYLWKTFKETRELVSLQGNLAINEAGEKVFHLHGVFSDRNYQTVAGHVKDLVAAATVEVFIHRLDKPLRRKADTNTGLQILDIV